jgi:Lysine-specific metallo-endopeptidase
MQPSGAGDLPSYVSRDVLLTLLESPNCVQAQHRLLRLQRLHGNSYVGRVIKTSKEGESKSKRHSSMVAGSGDVRLSEKQIAGDGSQPIRRKSLNTLIQRTDGGSNNIQNLRRLLRSDQESEAIRLMGRLSREDVNFVLESREYRELAVNAFNNDEMYRGVRAMRGDLYRSLEWMFDEGTDWEKLRNVVRRAPSGRARVRGDNWMKNQFVSEINDEQMCELVNLLGGSLLWKLSWMYAEGVGAWGRIRAKITARGLTDAQKRQVRNNSDIKRYFVSKLNDEQMCEAVDLLGGSLLWKLSWMYAEGVGSWGRIRAKLTAASVDERQKRQVRENREMQRYFVGELNRPQLWEAISLLGGNAEWLRQEGITEDCTPSKRRAIASAHPIAMEMLTNSRRRLTQRPLEATVITSLDRHFHSHGNWVARQVRQVLSTIKRELPRTTYECEAARTGMCSSAQAYTWWTFGDIHLCPQFFASTMSTRDRAETIIHEGAHLFTGALDLGYYNTGSGYASRSTFRALLNADPYSELANEIG